MNDLDKLILIIVGIGACIGLFRGFFKEAVGTLGLLLAAIAANYISPFARPYLGNLIDRETFASIIVWLIVFLLAMFLLSWLASLLNHIMSSINLSWLNRFAGGLFGALKHLLIVALVISAIEVICAHVEGLRVQSYIKGSTLIPYIHQLVDVITPWASQHILSPALEMLK